VTSLVDAKAREFAVTRTDVNVMVDAGAGSGKTKILVDRVCELVDQGVAIRNIAAVTFTEAAASELRDRLRAKLADSHPVEVADLDAAAIGTLHSFARRILAEHPVEAGLPPVVEVLDEVASSVRMSRWWSTVRAQLLADDAMAEALRVLLDAGIRVSSWSNGRGTSMESLALALQADWDLVEDHLQDVEPPSIPGPDFGDVNRVLADLTGHLADCTDPEDKLCIRIQEILAWGQDLNHAGSTREIVEVMHAAPSFRVGNAGRQGNWPDIKAVRACVASCSS
jgi:ATP-dependent helicase/nuclease subunit A